MAKRAALDKTRTAKRRKPPAGVQPAVSKAGKPPAMPKRGYRDLQEHIAALDAAGLLVTIDAPVNKDTELHPLVR
ncbi:MAG: 3-octaprenyl-4-hydroxybenzoate carboxy-lyase, partial [Pseudomonadota bacterium]